MSGINTNKPARKLKVTGFEGVEVEMQDARHRATADAALQGELSRPAAKDDLFTIGVLKDELRAFVADIKLALILQAVVIVVSTVGLLTLSLLILMP